MSQANPKELVAFLARSLVSQPDAVRVEETEVEGAHILKLTVAPEDLGKVIGRQGRTARALRTVLSAVAVKARRRMILEILE